MEAKVTVTVRESVRDLLRYMAAEDARGGPAPPLGEVVAGLVSERVARRGTAGAPGDLVQRACGARAVREGPGPETAP